MTPPNRTTPPGRLPTLGSIARSGTGLTVWCDDDACPHLREHGYRYQVIYTTEKAAEPQPEPPLVNRCRSVGTHPY